MLSNIANLGYYSYTGIARRRFYAVGHGALESAFLIRTFQLLGDAVLNAIIVDDEAPARSELRYLLGEVGGVEVLAEAASVREAIEKMQSYPVDVLFLDVSMPEVNGIQFAEALQRLKNPPAVIFVTAYSEHALEGFKVNAVDYLVKPVETDRLQQAVNRASEYITLHVKASQSERIPVEKGGKKILIPIDSIRFVMARDDYAYLQTDNDRYFSTVSARSARKAPRWPRFLPCASRLLGEPFACRRGRARSRRYAALSLNATDEKIPVSRRRVSSLKKALGL